MRPMKIIAVVCTLAIAGGMAAYAARAQAPSKQPIVRVAANTVRTADSNRTSAPAKSASTADSAAKAAQSELAIDRESYAYPAADRRDPFVSLMNTEELRPLIGDLKLVAVAHDPTGHNSVAILRDVTTKEQYRVKVGQQIGRMRVAAIHQKDVVFGIEEFGYSRQESLAMTDSTKVRTQ
jgi:hypothetical protein